MRRRKQEFVLSFDRSSPVRAYWLAHCEGFRVLLADGREGVVERIGFESADEPRELTLRMGRLRRKRTIDADAVEEVVPAERLLVAAGTEAIRAAEVVDARPREPSRARRVVAVAAPAAARAAVAAGRTVAAAVRVLLLLLSRAARALARAARRAGTAGSAAGARLAPVVRRRSLAAARALRLSAAAAAEGIERGAAAAAVRLRAAAVRGRTEAVRLRLAAAPRLRAGATRARRAVDDVNARLEGPLLRLHRRFAAQEDEPAGAAAPRPLLPRSFRPPARSERRPGSPTRSTSRRSS